MKYVQPHMVSRDLRGTPKPDYDSDSDSVGVGVGVGFFEKKFRSQIGVEVIITSDKILRFYEPITIFFITINIKKDNTCCID